MSEGAFDRAFAAFLAEFVNSLPSSDYGDGTADVTYSENTTLTASVYARNITVQEGVTLTISITAARPIFLFARGEVGRPGRIWNRGTIASNGSDAAGSTGGGTGDYAGASNVTDVVRAATPPAYLISPDDLTAYFSANAPGSGGTTPTITTVSGLDWRATNTPPWHDIHTKHQLWNRLDDPDQYFRLQGGSAGVATPGSTGGAGGSSGGFIGLIAHEVDNWDGVITAVGGDGSAAVAGTAVDEWEVATVYAMDDLAIPPTPNGFVYEAQFGGTSHATTAPTWPTATGLPDYPEPVWENTGDSDGNAAITPALPPLWAEDDYALAIVAHRTAAGTIGTPAGWTLDFGPTQHSLGGLNVYGYVRMLESGDTAPTFTPSGGAGGDVLLGHIVAWRGVDPDFTLGNSYADDEGSTSSDSIENVELSDGFLRRGITWFVVAVDSTAADPLAMPTPTDGLTWTLMLNDSTATGGGLAFVGYYVETPLNDSDGASNKSFVVDLPAGPHNWVSLSSSMHPVLGTGEVMDNNSIRWQNIGPHGTAGGGGGGSGGVVAWIGREWNGGAPTLTGGDGGDGLGTGNAGVDGATGFFVQVVDK